MKKNKNKFAKVATISGMCALGSLSADAISLGVGVHANPQQGIGASVDADVGVARANVGANVGVTGIDAGVAADVLGVGANTAGHVGFDGVKASANAHAWNVANVDAYAGATCQDGIYVGGTARALEPANTVCILLQNGQIVRVPAQQASQWIRANSDRVVCYQQPQRVVAAPATYVQAAPAVYTTQSAPVVCAQTAPVTCAVTHPVTYVVEQRPVVRHIVRRPVEMVTAEKEEIRFHHEHAEQTPNSSVYKRNDFHQISDPANGYHYSDKRQFIRTVTRQTIYR